MVCNLQKVCEKLTMLCSRHRVAAIQKLPSFSQGYYIEKTQENEVFTIFKALKQIICFSSGIFEQIYVEE